MKAHLFWLFRALCLVFYLFVGALLVFFLLFLFIFLNFGSLNIYLEKGSPFECGFYPFRFGVFPFSLPFFLISLIFLLFDVEIFLVCFYPLFSFFSYSTSGITFLIIFFIIFSTFFEWLKGVFI